MIAILSKYQLNFCKQEPLEKVKTPAKAVMHFLTKFAHHLRDSFTFS